MRKAILVAASAASTLLVGVGVAIGARPDMCVAANGAVRHQVGTATCAADGKGSVAIAKGPQSSANATNGDHNKAFAFGDASTAQAGDSDHNTAIASGDNSFALALRFGLRSFRWECQEGR